VFRYGAFTADRLSFISGDNIEQTGFSGSNINCEQLALEKALNLVQDNPEEESTLALKKIRLERGAVSLKELFIGVNDYRFLGQVQSGLVNLEDFLLRAGGLAFEAPLLSCAGDMQFELLTNTVSLLPLSDEPLSIRSQLSEVSLVTRSPEMTLQLSGERQLPSGQRVAPNLDAKLIGMRINQGEVVHGYAQFADAVLRGALQRGEIVVGPDASALSCLQLHSGEADVEIQNLIVQLPEDGVSDPELLLRARLRLASEVKDVRQPNSKPKASEEGEQAERLPISLFVERMGIHGQLGLTMDALMQAGADGAFNTWIESVARLDHGQATVAVRGQLENLRQAWQAELNTLGDEAHSEQL
jgi:hypothetical protein